MRLRNIAFVLISFALGLFFGVLFQVSKQTYRSEEIVAKEIELLEKNKNTPTCKDIFESEVDWGVIQTDDGVILWTYPTNQDSLKKVIVNKAMTVAFEELQLPCSE